MKMIAAMPAAQPNTGVRHKALTVPHYFNYK
jgi:hypothetical protein